MSGIYISGMKMPTSCDNCWALDDYGDYPRCRITEEQRGYTFPIREKRMDNCPLFSVSEHGELIERDTLSKRIKEETINQAEFYADRWHPVVLAYGDCYGKVQNAPTIIPADKEEQP